jgi:uncharacterized membrane protein
MSESIVGIAKSTSQVESTIADLQNNGLVPASDISLLMPDSGPDSGDKPEVGAVKATKAPEGATTGAVSGGAVGATVGLLAGIGALAIPGLGPFIAAGPIMAALSGAAAGATAGGVVGGLVGLGIPEYEAKAYEDRIKKGGYLVAVHVEDSKKGDAVRDIHMEFAEKRFKVRPERRRVPYKLRNEASLIFVEV